MAQTSYDFDNLPPGLTLGVGDRLFFTERRRCAVPLLVDASAVAEVASSNARKALLEQGLRTVTSVGVVEWLSTFEFEFTIVAAITGLQDPLTPVLAASVAANIAYILGAALLLGLTGWVVGQFGVAVTAGERAPKTLDTISLFPVAAVLIVAFWLIARKA